MNAGKSTSLLQSNHNYIENNLKTMLFIPKHTESMSYGKIVSRIGIEADALLFNKDFNFLKFVEENKSVNLGCILIDEAQFLTQQQVKDLGKVADTLNFPVMCYGIRTDFMGKLFEGSSELLALADNLIELKTICSMCPRKATMVVRLDRSKNVLLKGNQIQIGGNDTYKVVCRKHFRKLTNLI
tara:strand:- start:53 stop:604 length:552 start_codon:yes stop_codon:yes gene_type:complete